MQRKDDPLTILLTLATPVALIAVALSLFSLSDSIRSLSGMAQPHEHSQPISIAIGSGSALPQTSKPVDTSYLHKTTNPPSSAGSSMHSKMTGAPDAVDHQTISAPDSTPPPPPATTKPNPAPTTTTSAATQPTTQVVEAAPTGVNHIVQALNNSSEGAMVFSPGFIKISPGDSITFQPTSYGHNSQTPEDVIGEEYQAIPQGAKTWAGAMNEEFTITFTVPGVYLYLCNYHYVVGHVGVIQVGDDIHNLEDVKKAGQALKNKMFSNADRVDLYLAQVK